MPHRIPVPFPKSPPNPGRKLVLLGACIHADQLAIGVGRTSGGEIPTKRLPLSSLSPVDGRTVIFTLVANRLIAN